MDPHEKRASVGGQGQAERYLGHQYIRDSKNCGSLKI